MPGVRGAEGEEKGKGVVARRGVKEAPSPRAGRRTGPGYEVWHARGEWARAHEALHPQWGRAVSIQRLRAESAVSSPGRFPMGHPRWLREESSTLTRWEQSAEGIGGGVRQPPGEVRTDERGTRPVERKSRGRTRSAYTGGSWGEAPSEGPNGAPRGDSKSGVVARCGAARWHAARGRARLGRWDERAAGTPGADAPVGVHTPPRLHLPNRRIRDPYVRWCGRGEAVRPLPIPIRP